MSNIWNKFKKNKKALIASLVTATGVVGAAGLSIGLLTNNNQYQTIDKNTINNSAGNNNNTVDSKTDSFNMNLSSEGTTISDETKPENKSYHLTIESNIQQEGVIQLVKVNEDKTIDVRNELTFKPGEKIYVVIKMYQGYEDHTAREIKIYAGDNQSIYLTAQRVSNWNLKNLFEIQMPSYEETVNKETNKSWLYNENTSVKVIASFIKESIGINGNDVNWDQGAVNNSRAGYVYELAGDTTWTDATQKIYEAFENKDITKPIDIYFYLNGYTLTFDVDEINLDIKSGWALHFYNNKIDRRNPITGKYGEIRKAEGKIPKLRIQGAAVFGSSVKFKYMPASFGLWFENYETIGTIGACENDPEVRLAAVDPKPSVFI